MCKNVFETTTETPEDNPALLMARVANNQDKQAFVILFKSYAPKLKSWLIKGGASSSIAEEIIQETFLTLWQKAPLFNPEKASVATWIYTIARNKKIDKLRQEHYPELIVEMASDGTHNPDTKKDVRKALKVLNGEQFTVIYKNFFEGRTHQEIAKQEGVALGTVKSRARLALKKLHAVLNIIE